MVKIIGKIWEILTIFFAGIIVGIVVFIKFLDTPENEIHIKKIKNKKTSGSNSVEVQMQVEDLEKKEKRKFKLFGKK